VLTALVLICSAAVAADAHDCTRNNANTVMRVPAEFGNPATCFMHAPIWRGARSDGTSIPTSGSGLSACRAKALSPPRRLNERAVSLAARSCASHQPGFNFSPAASIGRG
jgi:hypothetical protein